MRKRMSRFQGLSEDTYRFFWEIAFQNNREFFEANRERYKRVVQEPLFLLAEELLPTALEIDPGFSPKLSNIVSRIRRDTRYTRDKSPYRDHAWLGFRPPMQRVSECFVIYAEFERDAYGYGMGMYTADSARMRQFRERMLARPEQFLSLVGDPAFTQRFALVSEAFKRPRFAGANEALQPWLNLRRLSFQFSSPELSRTLRPEIADEIREGMLLLKPLYRFLMGLA